MPKARIFVPPKNAMQQGRGKTKQWMLEYEPAKPYFIENLMGWSGMTDMPQQIRLSFPTRVAAEAYAKMNNIPYIVLEPKPDKQIPKAYADNFKAFKPK